MLKYEKTFIIKFKCTVDEWKISGKQYKLGHVLIIALGSRFT